MAAEILWEAPAASDSRLPLRAAEAVPASYAERAMNSLMRLHDELMGEKERRVDLMRDLFDRDRTIAELRTQLDATKRQVEAVRREMERLRQWKQPRPGVNPPPAVQRVTPPPAEQRSPRTQEPPHVETAPGRRPDPAGWKVW